MRAKVPVVVMGNGVMGKAVAGSPKRVVGIRNNDRSVVNTVECIRPPGSAARFRGIIGSLYGGALSSSKTGSTTLNGVEPSGTDTVVRLRRTTEVPVRLVRGQFCSFIRSVTHV